MNYGLEAFQRLPLLGDTLDLPKLPNLPVTDGQKESVALIYDRERVKQLSEVTLLRTGNEVLEFTPEFFEPLLSAPVKAGEPVGELTIKLDRECIQKIPIQTAEAVVPVDFPFYFGRLLQMFFSGEAVTSLQQLLP